MTRPAPEFYRSLDPVHFIGIGGIGMSALAGWMLQRGHRVQGSDLAANAQTAWLRTLGARIRIGHAAEHIKDAGLVVASSAVRDDNAEWRAAERRGLPRTRRAALLGALMQPFWTITVSGTHGKTTTTSLIAAVLEADG
ncbi:MAG: Mur ligase domain-containing protein, partial [Hyphomicrobiales bacterium]|nr:Mur ligase domain-containing protein [Hyphomicrobiales bacterium]